jgi:hypothetical protein
MIMIIEDIGGNYLLRLGTRNCDVTVAISELTAWNFYCSQTHTCRLMPGKFKRVVLRNSFLNEVTAVTFEICGGERAVFRRWLRRDLAALFQECRCLSTVCVT